MLECPLKDHVQSSIWKCPWNFDLGIPLISTSGFPFKIKVFDVLHISILECVSNFENSICFKVWMLTFLVNLDLYVFFRRMLDVPLNIDFKFPSYSGLFVFWKLYQVWKFEFQSSNCHIIWAVEFQLPSNVDFRFTFKSSLTSEFETFVSLLFKNSF